MINGFRPVECPDNLCEECGEAEITCECLVCGKELCEFCFDNFHFCEKRIRNHI